MSKAVTRNDTLVARFKDRLCALRATLFTSSYLAPRIDSAYALLRPFAAVDTMAPFTLAQFDSAYFAVNPAGTLFATGLHQFVLEQGLVLDSVLAAWGNCAPNAVVAPGAAIAALSAILVGDDLWVTNTTDETLTCEVVDASGRRIARALLAPRERRSVRTHPLTSGLILLIASGTHRVSTLKLMVVR
ncbi:MAG: hypothetical protein IPO17_16705 [Flavobacteriales bacterium]|nr:hypothetical protein [Flavobacteriales bacterium]